MRTTMKAVVMMMVLLGGPAVAAAGDFCLARSLSGKIDDLIVGKSFSLPNKGACNDFRGFFTGFKTHAPLVHGIACGTSDNTGVSLLLSDGFTTYSAFLERATLTGLMDECPFNSDSCVNNVSIQKIACSPSTVPIP